MMDDDLSPEEKESVRLLMRRRMMGKSVEECEAIAVEAADWFRHVSKSDAGGVRRIIKAEEQSDEAQLVVAEMREASQ